MPGQIIHISEYKNRDIVQYLEELTAKAKAGEITGLAFAARIGDTHATIGALGHYADDHISALGVVAKLFSFINKEAECSHCIHMPK
jgi:hypothetical protein